METRNSELPILIAKATPVIYVVSLHLSLVGFPITVSGSKKNKHVPIIKT